MMVVGLVQMDVVEIKRIGDFSSFGNLCNYNLLGPVNYSGISCYIR